MYNMDFLLDEGANDYNTGLELLKTYRDGSVSLISPFQIYRFEVSQSNFPISNELR